MAYPATQPKKAEKRGRQWVLTLGDKHVPVKKEFALRYNKRLDDIPEGLATRNLILELTTTLEDRVLHVLDLNLKKMASTLLPEPAALELQPHQDLQKERSILVADLDGLPDRLRYGKQCMQMADEIKKIQRLYLDRGFTFEEIKAQNPNFLVWSRVLPHLVDDDKEAFAHPGRWARRGDGGITGYAHRILAIVYSKSPATIQDWIKDYRLHERQRTKNSQIAPGHPR